MANQALALCKKRETRAAAIITIVTRFAANVLCVVSQRSHRLNLPYPLSSRKFISKSTFCATGLSPAATTLLCCALRDQFEYAAPFQTAPLCSGYSIQTKIKEQMKKILFAGITAVVISCAMGFASANAEPAKAKTATCMCRDCKCDDCKCTDCSKGHCSEGCCDNQCSKQTGNCSCSK